MRKSIGSPDLLNLKICHIYLIVNTTITITATNNSNYHQHYKLLQVGSLPVLWDREKHYPKLKFISMKLVIS